MCVKNRRKPRFCGSKEVRNRFLTRKSSKTSILWFERGTNSIFDPKIVENIDYAVRKRYQLDFWPRNRRKYQFRGSRELRYHVAHICRTALYNYWSLQPSEHGRVNCDLHKSFSFDSCTEIHQHVHQQFFCPAYHAHDGNAHAKYCSQVRSCLMVHF